MYTHSTFLPVDAELDRQLDAVVRDMANVPGAGLAVIEHPSRQTTGELLRTLRAALESAEGLDLLLGTPNGSRIVC